MTDGRARFAHPAARHSRDPAGLVDQVITVRVLTRVLSTMAIVATAGWWFLFDEVKSLSRDMTLQRDALLREIARSEALQVDQRGRLSGRVNQVQQDIQLLQSDVGELRAGVHHIGRTADAIFCGCRGQCETSAGGAGMTDWNPTETPNFSFAELACRCGCGRADMDARFMAFLQELRVRAGPLIIASGFRCADYNARVSSTGASGPHTSGKAVDVRCHGRLAHRIVATALATGATGVGVSQKGNLNARFVHLDVLSEGETTGPRPWLWSY